MAESNVSEDIELLKVSKENNVEDVEDVAEEITGCNGSVLDVDPSELPLIMEDMFDPVELSEELSNQEVSSDCSLPAPLADLYDDEYKTYSQKELMEKAQQLFYQITITNEEAVAVEERTRKQRESPEWHEQRHGRLTASGFHDVWARKDSTNPDRLVRHILYNSTDLSEVPAIQWVIKNESQAQQQYTESMSLRHTNFKCTSVGLVINLLYPHLGASPDGFISCDCCGDGVIEIKCPYSGRECHPKDLRGKLFLNSDGRLKHSHKYYTQIQGQLAVTDRSFCDFIVWTPKGFEQERVVVNASFWEKVQRKLTCFFVEHLLPEIMTHTMNPTELQTDEDKVYCLCEGSCEDSQMIACDNDSCKHEWFHFKCLGIKRAPKGTWFCPSCRTSDTTSNN